MTLRRRDGLNHVHFKIIICANMTDMHLLPWLMYSKYIDNFRTLWYADINMKTKTFSEGEKRCLKKRQLCGGPFMFICFVFIIIQERNSSGSIFLWIIPISFVVSSHEFHCTADICISKRSCLNEKQIIRKNNCSHNVCSHDLRQHIRICSV